MNKAITTQKIVLILGVPLLIFGIMMLITQSASFASHAVNLSLAITVDLLLIAPLVYYLLIRKTKIPKTSIVPVMIVGMLVGTMILPAENQYYLSLFKTWILPIVELAILAFVIYKVNKTIKTFKQKNKGSVDFMTALKNTCAEILPERLVGFMATEIAVFYYGFFDWKKRKLSHNEFSYHKNGGSIALLGSFLFLIVIELFVAHILLVKWNVVVAWVLTCFSIYSCIQFLGFIRSIYKRPIAIENGQLLLRHGIMTEAIIDINDIESVEISTKSIENIEHARKLSFLGEMDSHNIILRLRSERTLWGLYGVKRSFKTIAFYVDDKETFVKTLQTAIEQPEFFNTQEKETEVAVTVSSLTDKQKSIRATFWVLAISWAFGFAAFSIFDKSQQVAFGVSTLIFGLLPAIVTLVINKSEGGTWKDLQFVKPKTKNAIWAFLAPFVYFGIILTIQYYMGSRSLPDWNKFGSVNELIYSLILGYPVMLFLILGEEIAWRGYLQEKFIHSFGGVQGLVILGLIWGIWHLPLSLQGHNLPNSPLIESFITTPLMCIALSLIIGYYNFNSNSIFIGLLLHTSNNHFGGTTLFLTETYDELTHAMVFSGVYIVIIVIFGILYRRRERKVTS